ncbi:MAG: polysulfide reductase NrfD [Flavobacteriaceae bacterium]|nr:polysulfide reductase NrfD [Flavobacteriaceae bacterium]
MQEELFVSGRDLPNIDPYLSVWHWPISVDLFFGGLAAGLLFFAALFYLLGKEKEMPAAVKLGPIVAPIGITIALICLFYDLTHKLYFWKLYLTFRIESPMSFGSWVLLFITPISFLWVFSYLREIFPSINFNNRLLISIESFAINKRRIMAILLIPLSISLGIYTGILLSAFNARPLWNNAILGPLFLTSGLTTASAIVVYLAKTTIELKLFNKILLGLLITQLFLMTHMILGYFAGSEVQLEALKLITGGEFTFLFFGVVIILGLIVPSIFIVFKIYNYKIPLIIPVLLILLGGLAFRFVMVDAGQLTRYLY